MGLVGFYHGLKGGPAFSSTYDFVIPAISITGSLATPGAKTVTIRNVPLGVAGANANHYIRIAGGTGTAEVVLITGGTATSGAASGTLQFTTSNSHTGAYRITSATIGVQEAYYANPTSKSVLISSGAYTAYAVSTFARIFSVIGEGERSTVITLSSPTMGLYLGTQWMRVSGLNVISGSPWQTAGSLFKVPDGVIEVASVETTQCFISVEAVAISCYDSWFFGVVQHALYRPSSATTGIMRVSNVYADGRYYNAGAGLLSSTVDVVGAVVTRTAGSVFTSLRANGLCKVAGAVFFIQSVDSSIQITLTSAPTPAVGAAFIAYDELISPALIRIEGTLGGGTFTNLWFQATQVSFLASGITGRPANEIVVTNAIFDGSGVDLAAVSLSGPVGLPLNSSNSLRFSDIRSNTSGYGFLAQHVAYFSLSDSIVNTLSDFQVVSLQDCNRVKVSNSTLSMGGTSAAAISIDGSGTDDITFDDNTFRVASGGTINYCFAVGSSGITNVVLTNNKAYDITTGFITTAIARSAIVIRDNFCPIDPRVQVAVSGTETLVLPKIDERMLVEIVGGGTSGTVATMSTGYNGETIQILLSTAITFAVTGNIATALVGASGDYITGVYNSSLVKWLLK